MFPSRKAYTAKVRLASVTTVIIQPTDTAHQPSAKDRKTYPGQGVPGNRCGHVPSRPRAFGAPEQHRARPPIIRRAIDRISRFFDNPSFLPALNGANGKDRQQRSERREGCILILSAIFHYMDLVSMLVGVPQDDGSIRNLTMERLAEVAGIGLRRAERAVADLVAAGFLAVVPVSDEVAPGEFRGRAAVRAVPESLFGLLGLGSSLADERRKAEKRRKKKELGREGESTFDLVRRAAAERAAVLAEKAKATAAKAKAGASAVAKDAVEEMRRALAGSGRPP